MRNKTAQVLDGFGISARTLIDRLPIVDENILKEAANHPVLFIDAVRYRVLKMRKRARAEAALEYRRAQLGVEYRKKLKHGKPLTNDAVKAQIELSPAIRCLKRILADVEAGEEFAKLILEAYRYRRDGLRIIADAQVYEGMRETAEVERHEVRRKMVARARELQTQRRRIRG